MRHGAIADRVDGLDPLSLRGEAGAIAVNLFETLYQYDYLARPYVLVPLLARALPMVSADGLSWRIPLRTDARYADDPAFPGGTGRRVTAADVVFGLKRVADARNASPHWGIFAGRVAGLDAWHAASMAPGFQFDAPIEGLQAPDADTLDIRLVRPWPQLGHALAMLPTAPMAPEVVAHYGDTIALHPVGCGPYRLERWQRDVEIVLTRNPTWHGERFPSTGTTPAQRADAGRPLPFIDTLHFAFVRAGQPAWLLFLDGRLDYAGAPGQNFHEVVGPDRRLTPAMASRGIALYRFEASFSRWIGLNMADPLIAGLPALRRAISHALDRQEFNTTFLTGRSDLPVGLVPPAVRPAGPATPHPVVAFDLARARAALAEAEVAHGGPIPPLTMIYGGQGGVQRQVGQLIARNLEAIGLKLVIEYVDEDAQLGRAARDRGAQLLFGVGFRAAWPDAIDLFRRFYGPGIETGVNVFGYRSAAFDALYEEAAVLPDSPRRAALYAQMEALLLTDLPAIPYLEYNHVFLKQGWLENAWPHAFYGPSGLPKYQRLDVARRAEAIRGARR
ncbi:MAG: hypothetical protein KC549_13080 [Myxococcales bacterium]|nr:hypothetical protein [Myxococcales bacterium]